ncbi:MAG: hypothetical protein JXB62_21835 [Pirellulales bacterium]|nr:hypothetical protein [Pirellulales bacterium]
MWRCPKCGTEMEDTLAMCSVCGTSPDGTEFPTYHTDQRARAARRPSPVAGVPRRFGMGKLFGITALFAGLFGLLSWLSAHPTVYPVIVVFLFAVGAAQALFFGGKRPREASILAGFFLGPLTAVAFVGYLVWRRGWNPYYPIDWIAISLGLLALSAVGAGLGYVGGCLIASVFLGKRPSEPAAEDPPTDFVVAEVVERPAAPHPGAH